MPIPPISLEHRIAALEAALAKAVADNAAKDGFINQLVQAIQEQDDRTNADTASIDADN